MHIVPWASSEIAKKTETASGKSLWRSFSQRASLMIRIARCNDEQLSQCGLALGNDFPSAPLADQSGSPACMIEDTNAIQADASATVEAEHAAATEDESLTDEAIEIGREISGRVCRSLQDAREKTEDAVMAVCDHVTKLVAIARQGNEEAQGTLHTIVGTGGSSRFDDETSIAEVVHTQAESVNSFVADTREFFNQQITIGDAASKSCQEMQLCVAQVVKLVFSSEILAYNIQIESARLGDDGRAFSVLGDEMVRFSSKVRDANIAIQASLQLVTETMRQFQEQSKAMDVRLDEFTEQLRRKMDDVQMRTSKLTDSLHSTLERITHRNQAVIACSNDALSELQFQDPLAQSLMRTEMEVERLKLLIETGTCDSLEYSELNPCIGNDGSQDRQPGIVDLF